MTAHCLTIGALRASLAAAAAFLLAACSGGSLSLPGGGTTSYAASNAMMPVGYSEKEIDATHYEVKAAGSENTTRERVEKIALARAAEIGVENRLKYFRVANVNHGVDCGTKKRTKDGGIPPSYHPTVVLDVYYSKNPAPDFRPSEETFGQMKAELDADATPPDAKAAAAAQARAQCGAT